MTPTPTSTPEEDAAYYRRVLHQLIEIGTDLANQIHTQVKATPTQDLTIPFDRITRAIRRTITLARHVAQPLPTSNPTATPAQARTAARKRILRDVEDAIQRTPRPDSDSLHAELLDRLDGPDLDEDIATRPIAEIIADICRDLGLASLPGAKPWKRRTPEDIRHLCAIAATPPPAPVIPLRPRGASP